MSNNYDVIVIGLGGMGSAAAAHLAKRGQRVLGLDRYPPVHDQGSSHGRTRIIRKAYYEAPEYVPLVQRAEILWRELEEETGRALLTITGGLGIGAAEGGFVTGTLRSARMHHLPHELLDADAAMARFPAFRLPPDLVAVYEPEAGFLDPEGCVAAHLEVAARHGAMLQHEEAVRHWKLDGDGVRVETARGAYAAARLVITPGPWAAEVLADLSLPLEVERIVNVHFEPDQADRFSADRCPIYYWELPQGQYYGFPALPGQGLKFGAHLAGEICTPATIRRTVDAEEVEALRTDLNQFLPGAAGAVKWTLTCMYTLTPDRHFIIDRHPLHPQVAIACGFSGHGFKFCSAVGEALADLALSGATTQQIGFLSAKRFGAV